MPPTSSDRCSVGTASLTLLGFFQALSTHPATNVLIGLLFAFVYPTRTFLDQRADTSRARAQLELLQTENKRLAREAKKLQSDSEIERRGRAYGLVKPEERPFVIIPEPTTTLPAGTASPAP